jgi:RND family efflux transporter MFP subunit
MAGAVVLAAAIAAILWTVRPRGVAFHTARASTERLVVPIQCDGTIEAPPGGELRALENAVVGGLPAREGERVRKGQELVRLESPDLAESLRSAQAQLLRVQAELARARSDLAEAVREEDRRTKMVEGDRRLLASGAVTPEQARDHELALRNAEARREAAASELDSLEGRGEASSRLALARASVRDLERRVAALVVRAPSGGVVYGLPRHVGEAIAAGQVVANVADLSHLRIRARVDQPDLPRIREGQRLVVTFDGLPSREWPGRLTLVSPGLRNVAGREIAEVLGEISDPGGELPPNASVNVQIIVGEKPRALVIPRSALFRDGGRRYVFRLEGSRARRVEVETGLLGLNQVEIASGLTDGDRVLLPGAEPLRDGMRVSAARP